ncbi:hypothetical protein ABIE26_003278 [Pedobacter africanus]|uniref:Uncharacterized protein n=1 Tax=Pedobacter africanus TaxID=151894 RepID=A0ACC6KZE0_9SPHI|nr:DUF4843 domain-containing protein [Pedobacter africanus]MDR6784632.1 hypothetical protein [Pedobacter africanus]
MKRILAYLLLFQLAMVFAGCEKEIIPYKGKEGVYFSVRNGNKYLESYWPYVPFSSVEFVRIGKDVVEFPVMVTITGAVKDYARSFRLEVNPDSTTAIAGTHYEPLKAEWIIPPGAISTFITVRLKRTPDLKDKPVSLGLRLVATKDFELSFPEWDAIPTLTSGTVVPEFDASLHTLKINDIMVQPEIWRGSLQPGNKESGLFGVFTRRKMEFLIENLGLKYEDFESEESMPVARSILVGADASAILIKRFNEKKPVLEEDGRLMFIGSVPWTSIIGVPYVP